MVVVVVVAVVIDKVVVGLPSTLLHCHLNDVNGNVVVMLAAWVVVVVTLSSSHDGDADCCPRHHHSTASYNVMDVHVMVNVRAPVRACCGGGQYERKVEMWISAHSLSASSAAAVVCMSAPSEG